MRLRNQVIKDSNNTDLVHFKFAFNNSVFQNNM